jgi:DNA-binding CsgD family transcriptional regulator
MTKAPSGIEELVSAVLKRRASEGNGNGDGNTTKPDPQTEEIIFDGEIDGARYLLIRVPVPVHLHAQLSPREQEIVRLIALGHSNKIIAGVLNISSWTVCTHMRRIFAKLGVGSRAAVVAMVPEIRRTCSSE